MEECSMGRKAEAIGSAGGAIAGVAAGAKIGAGIGIAVGGPIGAFAGTIPCAIVGGVIGLLGGNKIGIECYRSKEYPKSGCPKNVIQPQPVNAHS